MPVRGPRPLILATVALGLILVDPAVAQVREPGCLEPLPGPLNQGHLPRTLALQSHRIAQGETAQGLSVSPGGHLCRDFSLASPLPLGPQVASDRAPSPGRAFLLSAAVPGGGQWYLGQGRWPAYLAAELWAWIQFLDSRREGHRLQRRYKDLAWLVARRISTGRRTDAGWDYYEALTKFKASGAFDTDPEIGGVQPENDPSTFNGSMWALAQQIFLPDDPENPVAPESPAYDRAFDYYQSRAYAPELAWDWGSNTLHQEEYGNLIREADEALRTATGMVGIILANHLLSAVDALVSGRLGMARDSEPLVQAYLVPGAFHHHEVGLSIRLPTAFDHVP